MHAISSDLRASADTQTARLAELAAQRVAAERAKKGGQSSGQTMMIMASTLKEVQQGTKTRTRKKWVKVVLAVAGAAFVVVAVMSVVIIRQRRQIDQLVKQKDRSDKQRAAVEQEMDTAYDPDRDAELEQKLTS